MTDRVPFYSMARRMARWTSATSLASEYAHQSFPEDERGSLRHRHKTSAVHQRYEALRGPQPRRKHLDLLAARESAGENNCMRRRREESAVRVVCSMFGRLVGETGVNRVIVHCTRGRKRLKRKFNVERHPPGQRIHRRSQRVRQTLPCRWRAGPSTWIGAWPEEAHGLGRGPGPLSDRLA